MVQERGRRELRQKFGICEQENRKKKLVFEGATIRPRRKIREKKKLLLGAVEDGFLLVRGERKRRKQAAILREEKS